MSKPYVYNNIDIFLDDLEEQSKVGEAIYNQDEAKEFMKGLYGINFDEEYFDEGWSKRTIGRSIPKELGEIKESPDFTKEVEKTLTYDPQDPFFQLDLVTPKTMFGLEKFVDDKLAKEIEDKNLNEVQTQRLKKDTYENMFGGEIPLTKEGELIPKALGFTQKEFLNLSKQEKYLLANRYRNFEFTGFEKIRLGASQGTKELSTSSLSGNDPQRKHAVQQQYIELGRMLDDKPDSEFGYDMGVLFEGLTTEAKEQFKQNNQLVSTQFPPKAQILYNRLTKKISEITLETDELKNQEYTPEIQNQIVENQMVLYGLVDKINEMINSPDLKISREAVDIKAPIDGSPQEAEFQWMQETVLKDAKNRDKWTQPALQRIIDAGGGLEFSPSEQSSAGDKALQFLTSNFDEMVVDTIFGQERPKEMLIEQLENRLGDLKDNEADNDEIVRVERLLTKAKQFDISEGVRSEFVDVAFSFDSYEDAIETIRKINFETVGDEDEFLSQMIDSMSLLDSYIHDAVGVDESSLDGDKIRIEGMDFGLDFLLDPQIKSRMFEGLPKYMQAIFLQNISQFDDGRDVTVENLRNMTVEEINLATDIAKNLDTDDLKRFVNYRDQVVLSGPGQLMQFMIDIGSTPTFNPHTQTFTKEINSMGRILFTIAPFAQRLVTEGVVGGAVAGAKEGPVAAFTVGTGLESVLDNYGVGFSDMPSYSSRVAAKIAIGDPGMMGDLPYIVHLYGGGERAEILAEYVGLGLDFLIPSERLLVTNPVKRVGKTFGKLDYPRVKKGDTVSPNFRESLVEATVGLPDGMEYTTSVVLPAFALGETLLTGTGLGIATEMAYQFKQTLKGEGQVSPKIPRKYNQLNPKEQAFIDEVIAKQYEMDRSYNILEVIVMEEEFNLKFLVEDGMDLENPRPYAEIRFPGDEEMQNAFVNRIKIDIKGLKDRLEVMGISPDEAFAKIKANMIEEAPFNFANAHMQYESNSTIPKKVRNSESYKNAEKIIFGREDLSPAEKNAWMGNLYANAELLFPDNPKQFFDQAYFDEKPITQVSEQSFDNVNVFYSKVLDDSVTANELMMSLADEPISTRGVANFYAASEIDGIPALFEDTNVEISKDTVSKHYTRSIERSSKFETKDYGGSLQTARFLDTQYNEIRARKLKLESENNVEALLSQERILTESGDLPQELANVKKELDKGGKGRSLREKYEKASTDLAIFEELGSEQYLVDQRIRKRAERIESSDRFKMSEEEKAVLQQIDDMTVDADTLREAQFLKREKSVQQELLNEIGMKKLDAEVSKSIEEITQLRQELSVTDNFLEQQAIIEKIEKKQSFVNNTLLKKGLDEKNVKTYDLGGKNEKARVRFVDENDGIYRVETMRSVTSQKEALNLNKELYYRSEYTKAILEDASSNGYKTVTIPLGEVGIFHETMGSRVKTKDYHTLLQNRKRITELKEVRNTKLNELSKDSTPKAEIDLRVLEEDIVELNTRIERLLNTDKTMYENLKKTESHSSLNAIEDKFVEIIEDYVKDIDENIKVERNDNGLVVHLTEDFRNVIGRTIEEEPTVYFEKGVQFVAPKEDMPILPRLEINEEQINAVKEARNRLIAKSNQLEEKIKNAKDTRKFIQIENKNIQIELQRLKDFEETGFFESDGTVQFFEREDGKIVISIGDYNIVGREFLKGEKKGFLFESLVDKKTGEEVQTTLNKLTERAAAYEKFKTDALKFSKEMEEFAPYLKYFETFSTGKSLSNFSLTKEQYINFRQKLEVTSEPKDFGNKTNLNNLIEGEKKRKARKSFTDETTIDQEFRNAFIDKSNKIRDLFRREGINQTEFTRTSKGKPREVKTIQKAIKTRNKNILTRFEEKHEGINTTVLRYLGNEFESEYTQQLKNTQDLKMSSLNVSETTKLISEMLSRQYDMFGFDSASGHMLQNFADIFDQVGTASSPDLIRAGKKIVPVLNLGMGKEITKSFFGQELSASINTDLRVAIDYLGRNKLSKTEQAKLNTMRKLFGIDETLPLEEQKARLQEGNDMYQTYQTKRTDQTYHGLRKKSLKRLVDGIDEIYKDLPKTKQVDRALLMEKQKELELQMKQYERLENEAVVFTFGGDKLHTDIMHFAADQTEGFGRMQGIMNDLQMVDEEFLGVFLNLEEHIKSYVENMVLDSAQLGFDSIGFEKSLQNSRSVKILRDIAQRFGKDLEEAVVFDRSGEIPVKYEFVSFKIPNELKENVTNVSRTRFVRSIKTQDPVRLNGSHILQMVENGEIKIRTPYGELELKINEIKNSDAEAILQIVSDVNKEINRVDFYNLFESPDFEQVAPEVAQDYQQSMYAKGVAYEFQEALQDYVQFTIEGLDEIENVSIDQLKRASKPIKGEITLSFEDAEALGLADDFFEFDEPQIYEVQVEPVEGRTLSFFEMVALEKGIGLNDTLKMLQEQLIQNDGDYTKLGFALSNGEIYRVLNQNLPEGFVESSFGQHPQAAFTPLLPLLFEQYSQRVRLLEKGEIVRTYGGGELKTIDAEPVIARPEIEQGDVVSQIEIDGNRLKIKLSDTMTFNDFLVTNANILEMMMPDTAYKHMASHYDSVGGRLTSQGVQQFASEMMYYIKNDVSPDLRTRAIFDHSLGYLSRWWDVVHRQEVSQGLNTQFNTIFNPHGKAISQAVTIGKKRSNYKVRVSTESSTLKKIEAEPSKKAKAQLREKLAIPTQKVLLEQLNASPSVRKLQKYAVNDKGQPLYRFGEIKVGDEIDPLFLVTTLYGMTKADQYKNSPRFTRGSKLAILGDIFAREKVVQLTEKHFVPESVRDQVNGQVENQLKIIFGDDFKEKFLESGRLEFDSKIRRHFISVVNSLGDTHKSFPQSLVDFVINPEERMHITRTEYNAFVDALKEREVPYGFSNRSVDVKQNMKTFGIFGRKPNKYLQDLGSASKLREFFEGFVGFFERYFQKEDILADLPPTLRDPFLAYMGDLKKTTADITRRMRELAANGEEGQRLRQRLERLGVPEAEIEEMVNSFLLRNNTHKRMSAMQLIIQENLLELERVDRHKLDLFFRLYDEIVDTGFKDGTTIFDMFTFEKLDQIENVFTSRKFGISDSEVLSLNFIREVLEDFKEQKRLNPNKTHEMSGDQAVTMYTAINEIQNGLMNRYNYLDSIGDEVFRRFTGYTKADSGLDGYTSIINRKLLTLLFEGRYIHEPSIDIVRKHVRTEDIFAVNEKGQIYFKGSGEILSKKSARDFLYANGYGFIDKDGYKLFQNVSREISSDLTLQQLSEVVAEIIRTKEADSIQTFLAVDTPILNNFLAIDPKTGRHDMLAVLGGLGILTHEKLASQRLADRLSRSSFQDLDQRIAQRREQYGNYFIDDMENFRSKVVTYMEQMISGTMRKNPSDNPNAKPIMIIDGELPEPSAPLLEIEAHNMAMDIMKDLELPIQAARKNVAEIDINGQKYILPKDFIQGLERIRQEIIGSLTLGRYGESEILDNMVLYEAERTKITDLVDEEIKNQILENSTKPRETVKEAIIKSVAQGSFYTFLGQLLAYGLADGFSLGAASLTLASFSAMESLKFSSIRKLVNDYAQGFFGDKLDAVKTQMVADNLFHQLLTRTYHVFEGQDKAKLMEIKQKYEGKIPIALEKNLIKISKGTEYGLFGATAMSLIGPSFGLSTFINPYIGLSLAIGTRVFNKLFMETDYFKGLTRQEANAQFVKEIQEMYTKVHKPLLDEIGEREMTPESRRKFNAYIEEAKRLRTYVESQPYRDNVAVRQVDRLIGVLADTFNVPKISTTIKMSVTALSGLQYWTTSFFGMMNQEHLDLGNTKKFLASAGAGIFAWQISGSFFLGLSAAKMARVMSEAMGRKFTFGKKKAQMYRGPTAMKRPSQIAMFLQDIQETSLGNRIGVSEGAYIGLGLMEMGVNPMFGAAGGVISGFTYKVLLDKYLKKMKLDDSRGKFMLFTRGGKVYTYKEVLQYMQTYDVLTTYVREETGQILASELRMLYPDSKLTVMHQSFLRSAMEVAESYDLYGRVGMFLDELEMGTSPKEAAEKVRNLYFDYSDLSDFEKDYLRNVFLFYSFMRKNAGFMSRKLLSNPERVMGWARLTKGTQEMAFRDGESDLYVGDFWQGRMMLPPTIFESFENIDAVGVPFRHRTVQVLPMTNVYDLMLMSSAIFSTPLISDDSSPFYRYILTSMGPVGQAAIIPLTEKIPFSGSETRFQNISPRMILMSQRLLGYRIYGPEGSGAFIEYVSNDLQEYLRDGRTLATAERKKFKEPNPLDGRIYRPAKNSDGFNHFVFTNMFLPATHRSPLGLLAFPMMPAGRPARTLEAMDRLDLSERMVGAATLDFALRLMGYKTNKELIAQAQLEMQQYGMDYTDPEKVGQYAKKMVKKAMAIEMDRLKVSPSTNLSVITLADEYILTDDTPYNGLLGQMAGLPFIASPSDEALEYQVVYGLQKKIGE